MRQHRVLGGLLALLAGVGGALATAAPGQAAPGQAASGQAASSQATAPLASTFFHLQQLQSLRCADVRAQDGDRDPGARIQLRPCASDNVNQEWTPIRVAGNTYLLQVQVSGMCMDLADGSTAEATQVVQFPCDISRRTQWWTTNGVLPPGGTPLSNGANPAECLDSQGSFAKIISCGASPSPAATWFFTQ